MQKMWLYIPIFIIVLYLAIHLLLYFLQEQFIFHPTPLPVDYTFSFEEDFEEVTITAKDGANLSGIHFKAHHPRGMIVYFHGNGASLVGWTQASYFLQYGYDLLVFNYRGYGKSTGKRSEKKLYQDAELVYQYALKKYPENQLMIYGRSMGSGLASYLASKHHPAKLILETPFYSMREVVQSKMPFIWVDLILRFPFRSDIYLVKTDCPIYILHGTHDQVVPLASAQKLATLVPHRTHFTIIPKGEHNNLGFFEAFREEMEKILSE
jgi:uncharacterized protein